MGKPETADERRRSEVTSFSGDVVEVAPAYGHADVTSLVGAAVPFEDLGDRTKLTQTMRFATTEGRDTTMQYGVEEGAKGGFARIDALLQRLPLDA